MNSDYSAHVSQVKSTAYTLFGQSVSPAYTAKAQETCRQAAEAVLSGDMSPAKALEVSNNATRELIDTIDKRDKSLPPSVSAARDDLARRIVHVLPLWRSTDTHAAAMPALEAVTLLATAFQHETSEQHRALRYGEPKEITFHMPYEGKSGAEHEFGGDILSTPLFTAWLSAQRP